MEVQLGDTFYWHFGTTSPSTGNATNADSTPVVTIEEDGVTLAYAATVSNSGVGLYRVTVVASAPNGFEALKRYSGWVAATVGGATGRDGLFEFFCVEHTIDSVQDVAEAVQVDTRSLLSNVQEVFDNQLSMLVAIKSAWSNTISIKTDTTSIAISTSSLLVNVARMETSLAIGVNSLLANVATVDTVVDTIDLETSSILVGVASLLTNVARMETSLAIGVASLLVATRSALSNTLAILVSTSSLLSNVANVDADLVAALTAIPANVMASTVEGTLDLTEAMRVMLALAAGAVSVSGAIRTFMDQAGTKARISGTEDSDGQRSGVTVDGS